MCEWTKRPFNVVTGGEKTWLYVRKQMLMPLWAIVNLHKRHLKAIAENTNRHIQIPKSSNDVTRQFNLTAHCSQRSSLQDPCRWFVASLLVRNGAVTSESQHLLHQRVFVWRIWSHWGAAKWQHQGFPGHKTGQLGQNVSRLTITRRGWYFFLQMELCQSIPAAFKPDPGRQKWDRREIRSSGKQGALRVEGALATIPAALQRGRGETSRKRRRKLVLQRIFDGPHEPGCVRPKPRRSQWLTRFIRH